MNEQWFAERTAIVTGGARGIGRACSVALAERGATVVAGDVANCADPPSAAEDAPGTVHPVEADVTDPAALESLVEAADDHGGVDVLVNNAGVVNRDSIEDLADESWQAVLDVNLTGAYNAIRAAVPSLRASSGSIVTISSLLSQVGTPNRAAYSASKGGLDAMTRSLAAELGPHGIRVNAVNPGFVRTGMNRELVDAGREDAYRDRTAIGRLGEPEDVAATVAFLASDHARFISGETIRIDGGQGAIG